MKRSPTKYWGFNVKDMDRTVRPQDDFYRFANGGWLRSNSIPPTESRWGSFTTLRYRTEHQMRSIVKDLLKKERAQKGSVEQLTGDLYRSAIDLKRRNELGLRPIESWRNEIRGLSSIQEMLGFVARMHRLDFGALWTFFIDQDSKDSDKYLLYLWQGGIGMPDRDYYLKDQPEQKRVRDAYIEHIKTLLRLAGADHKDAERSAEAVMKIETLLARASMTKEETRDLEKTYNKRTMRKLAAEVPSVDWSSYFKTIGAPKMKELLLAQPLFFAEVDRLLRTIPLEEWKRYLEWHLISDYSSLLSHRFVRASFDFYGKVLSGTKKMRPLWRRALSTVNGVLGEALGKIYVERYFSKEAKKTIDALVSDLFAVYEDRIMNLDWMSPATKKKAVIKLRSVGRKIGYPAKFERYKGLVIKADDYFGNMMRALAYEHRREMRRLGRGVDRKEWFMTPQTVNAYCHFNLNEIVFPAAILQFPFFDPNVDDAINYAGIGATIGHEITHHFDDKGSKFDSRGNMKNWWKKSDEESFKKKGKILVRQFDAYEVAPGVHASGELTLGENIADLGGLSIAFDAFQRHLKKTGRKVIDGFTPEQRFFLGFAQAERELSREEFTKLAALTDPHAHAPLRVNGPLSNFPAFYEVFEVKKGDKLYRPAKDQARIW